MENEYRNCLKQNDEYKSKIDAHSPLSTQTLKQIKDYFKISFTYSSNAIEGNTLDLVETKIIIEDGITIGGKPIKDHMEAIGGANDYLFLRYNKIK